MAVIYAIGDKARYSLVARTRSSCNSRYQNTSFFIIGGASSLHTRESTPDFSLFSPQVHPTMQLRSDKGGLRATSSRSSVLPGPSKIRKSRPTLSSRGNRKIWYTRHLQYLRVSFRRIKHEDHNQREGCLPNNDHLRIFHRMFPEMVVRGYSHRHLYENWSMRFKPKRPQEWYTVGRPNKKRKDAYTAEEAEQFASIERAIQEAAVALGITVPWIEVEEPDEDETVQAEFEDRGEEVAENDLEGVDDGAEGEEGDEEEEEASIDDLGVEDYTEQDIEGTSTEDENSTNEDSDTEAVKMHENGSSTRDVDNRVTYITLMGGTIKGYNGNSRTEDNDTLKQSP
ncbi:hypothetical protein M409DRAFT_60390 [Zasmidium cellare ATCC 36951]|uniref:Uncharacterized protein n=1 Tax=Zasmidium cellare ATCC 36951 TaxID=1080233 RepID=A0A6A6C2N3_ZASCE|nr:uncharacterized protein M409DRAFT_60390 [Zasmidium cellare ATCC 36951]KAF2159989.1 hypothetical protein M409DRAFT_60390 [Zasmidium cellare ATCC 36951]